MKTTDQQDVHFYTAFIVIFVFGRGSKQQLDTQASSEHRWSFMGASWRPLGASWSAAGAIWDIKMCIFTQVLQAFSLLDPFGDAQLQALAIHAS